jgi:uncharacterized membrane protein YjdF
VSVLQDVLGRIRNRFDRFDRLAVNIVSYPLNGVLVLTVFFFDGLVAVIVLVVSECRQVGETIGRLVSPRL